jgi:CheY-like chemotaxis protein
MRLVGEDIELKVELSEGVWPVRLDQSQLEQVVMNLVVNARDAMPEGGVVHLRTANVSVDDTFCLSHLEARAGEYVLVSVCDAGTGMDPETRAHIFEPFYTTKPEGKGTGLGLATVYGIVKQCGGFIDVATTPGRGTNFGIYLPRAEMKSRAEAPTAARPSAPAAKAGTEKILVVEDDETLRDVVCQILISHGYAVRSAASGEQAVRVSEEEPDCALLLTDVVMPGLNGRDLAAQLTKQRPRLKVIYMSGYGELAIIQKISSGGAQVLAKPFSVNALTDAVRRALS